MRIAGEGIHSGLTCEVRLHRAGGPTRFRRAGVEIEASINNVIGAERTTSLGVRGARVHLVEHLLAALRILGHFSGVVVEASRDELPILDGSAAPWLEAASSLGAPEPPPVPYVITEPLLVELKGGSAHVTPGEEHLSYAIDFPHPAIGKQQFTGGPEEYLGLAKARTFGFLAEWEELKGKGLALGAAEGRAIVFNDEGPLSPLRHPQEPVRHKALDALGDLALLGRPLEARVAIQRGSHALHHATAHAIMKHAVLDRAGASP